MSKTESELIQLRAENDALKALLAKHGIAVPPATDFGAGYAALLKSNVNELSSTAKVMIFRRLFRGRDDIYPVRWTRTRRERLGIRLSALTNGNPAFANCQQ